MKADGAAGGSAFPFRISNSSSVCRVQTHPFNLKSGRSNDTERSLLMPPPLTVTRRTAWWRCSPYTCDHAPEPC